MSTHDADDAASKGPRRERIALRRPPPVEHAEDVDLALVAEIIRGGSLTAEIDDANNYDPDLAV